MEDVSALTKVCRSCGEEKAIAEFDVRADTGTRRTRCKACRRRYQRARWVPAAERPSRVKGDRDLYLCRRCGKWKSADAFQPRHRNSPVLQSWCRDCFREYRAERHRRLHDREMARIRRNDERRVGENRQRILEYLATHPCVDCGESDPIVLDFDHLRDKRKDVSVMVANGWKWSAILEEIAKCEVRCANDHRRVTYQRRLAAKKIKEAIGPWSLRPGRDLNARPAPSKGAALSS